MFNLPNTLCEMRPAFEANARNHFNLRAGCIEGKVTVDPDGRPDDDHALEVLNTEISFLKTQPRDRVLVLYGVLSPESRIVGGGVFSNARMFASDRSADGADTRIATTQHRFYLALYDDRLGADQLVDLAAAAGRELMLANGLEPYNELFGQAPYALTWLRHVFEQMPTHTSRRKDGFVFKFLDTDPFTASLLCVGRIKPIPPKPFVGSPIQVAIHKALDGKAMSKQALANEVCGGEGTRLYKPHGIKEMMADGIVKNKPGVGYYRPDSPPPTLVISTLGTN